MKDNLLPAFEPAAIEGRWYRFWREQGYFAAAERSDKPAYCIVIPPPNITGALHMGHALTATIQDLLIRFRRMQGHNTLWLPGTDHAGIATQMVVERQLARQGIDRHALGREAFVEHVWAWKQRFGSRITEQHERLGASVDWARERFTLDEGLSRAVREVFVRLYEEGLLFRDRRLVNWCPACRSALSDLEVDREEPEQGELYAFAYPLEDGSEIVVATTRPETMLGDTAIAVHPDDERYRHLIGKAVRHPFLSRSFPIIGDALLADPELGTGAVKVTPGHDPNDFACGKRNGLEFINLINPDGTLNEQAGPFAGLERFEARRRVKQALAERGLERGAKPHLYAPGRCYRHPDTIVEPLLSTQWFVEVKPLAAKAIEAVRSGAIEIIPAEWAKTYYHWMENIQPWCVSRQLWWGHRIPAWHCADCQAVTVAREAPVACSGCGGTRLRQDEDVLDTWFSSALWPFSTLGWPDKTPLLATFYPTSVMETGYDILFFWVARMIMMGVHLMGEVPFRKVLLHAMVRDERGKKMSKATGNVIDPLDVIDGITLEGLQAKLEAYNLPPKELERARKAQAQQFPTGIPACGTDAMRFTLAAYTAQTRDIHLSLKRIEGYRKFGNKIWQATRFTLQHLPEGFVPPAGVPAPASLADRWLLSRLHACLEAVERGFESFAIGEATQALYRFVWDELCDWYLERVKPILNGPAGPGRDATCALLYHALETTLRALHPIMPFITEELWQALPRRAGMPESIMISPFPTADAAGRRDAESERHFAGLMEAISAIRAVRSDYNLPPRAMLRVELHVPDASWRALCEAEADALRGLAQADLTIAAQGPKPRGCAVQVLSFGEAIVALAGLVDVAAERGRLEKERARVGKDIATSERKLGTASFVERAPEEVVATERQRLDEARAVLARVEQGLARLAELAP